MAEQEADVVLERRAARKLLLHACQWPSLAVNGVLVGHAKDGKLVLQNAFPLFHNQLALSPMLEVALSSVQAWCDAQGTPAPRILGYYHANAGAQDTKADAIACRIADHLLTMHSETVLLLVDNPQLTLRAGKRLPLSVWRKSGSSKSATWSVSGHAECSGDFDLAAELAAGTAVVDWDQHLEDVSKDWLNDSIGNQ